MIPANHWKMVLSFVSAACSMASFPMETALFCITLIQWWWRFIKGTCDYSSATVPRFRGERGGTPHAWGWLHHLQWNNIPLLWPAVCARRKGKQARWAAYGCAFYQEQSCDQSSRAALHMHLLHCLCPSVALTGKPWWKQCYLNILSGMHTLSSSYKMLLKHFNFNVGFLIIILWIRVFSLL